MTLDKTESEEKEKK